MMPGRPATAAAKRHWYGTATSPHDHGQDLIGSGRAADALNPCRAVRSLAVVGRLNRAFLALKSGYGAAVIGFYPNSGNTAFAATNWRSDTARSPTTSCQASSRDTPR